jgi:hypothetical protein
MLIRSFSAQAAAPQPGRGFIARLHDTFSRIAGSRRNSHNDSSDATAGGASSASVWGAETINLEPEVSLVASAATGELTVLVRFQIPAKKGDGESLDKDRASITLLVRPS